MIRLVILALVLVSSCGVVLGQFRALDNPCAEFKDGLLPYCLNLDLPAVNSECGEPYDVTRRNKHARNDVFHVGNSKSLRGTSSHAELSFTMEELEGLDFFNPSYQMGAYQNGLGRPLELPLTDGAARVDCPPTTTDMRIQLGGLSPNQKIWMAGDSDDVEGEGDWHGDLKGPYDSETIMKALGFTTFSPGSGVVVFVEGKGAENVFVKGALCTFKSGEWTQKIHNLKRKVVSRPPYATGPDDFSEEMELKPEEFDEILRQMSKEETEKRGEEVFTGVDEAWDGLNQFGSGGDNGAAEGRPYTPMEYDFCAGDDYPCADFCDFNNPCTVNSECMRDDQYPFDRTVPEYAAGHINFIKLYEGALRGFICSGGLIGQAINYPPTSSCDGNFAQTCPDGLYNNINSKTFLTSGHCLSTQEAALTAEVVFNYSISCEQGITGNCFDGSDKVKSSYNFACASTVSGANLLVSSESPEFYYIQNDPDLVWLPLGDFTLLSLTGPLPRTRCYFGYSTINYADQYGTVLHRVSHPGGAPRAYCASRVSQGSDWAGGPLATSPVASMEDFFASMHINITGVGMSALGPQGGSSGGILFNDDAQAVGTQTGWSFFWGWIRTDLPCCSGFHGDRISGLEMDPCKPNYFGPQFFYRGRPYQVVNQYIVVDGAFYSYFDYVEEDLQDLCCPPFEPDYVNNIVSTTKLDFSIYPDGSPVLPPGGAKSGLLNPRHTWADWGIEIITQKIGAASDWSSKHPPQLFNSSNPGFGDDDLGSPNHVFGGPGDGPGGESGPGKNDRRLDWVMIISERNKQDEPDDEAGGGAIVFLFDDPVPLDFVEILDIDFNEVNGFIEATDDNGMVYKKPIIAYGDNAYYRADFYVKNIVNITVYFPGSGAVGGITFCDATSPTQNALGDYVWFDQNGNGVQDVYETTPIPGVTVQLHRSELGTGSNQRLAETVTDENGWYGFDSLGDGNYVVSFTVDDDLPFFDDYKTVYGYEGWSFSPANQGGDDVVDSDALVTSDDNRAITEVIPLAGGMKDYRWDCGIVILAEEDLCVPISGGGVDDDDLGFIFTRGEKRENKGKDTREQKKTRMSYRPKRHGKLNKK